MRYGIFADVHSNIAAFEAVHTALQKVDIDQYVFVGDIVGYGASPHECIALLRKMNALSVVGNHDLAVIDFFNINRFNDFAKESIRWTKKNLSNLEKMFLSGVNLIEEGDSFHLAHGSLYHPENFEYMTNKSEAMKTFCVMKRQICFVAHSHIPGIFIESEEDVQYKVSSLLLIERGRRYVVNVGSVGQPRDGDANACYCVYDDQACTIEIKRVSYDVAKAQKDILNAGLPQDFADRLAIGR
ncbi:MAG: metallophosphoesterase family protein [Candidatus Omnitrophota bacterium]